MIRKFFKGQFGYYVMTLMIGAFFLAVVASYSFLAFGSIGHAIAYLRGERLHPITPIVTLGNVQPGHTYEVEFPFVNLTGHPITVVGATSSCGCTSVQKLPVTVPASGRCSLTFKITPKAGRFEPVNVELYTDVPGHTRLSLTIFATSNS
jgi:Protein of unknown function (DUF1573)